ncbi:hypothetical protein INR49_021979 [Caranx melampygus]|nr:hypothetical protein INR49_021979 [Caranx melampygus]
MTGHWSSRGGGWRRRRRRRRVDEGRSHSIPQTTPGHLQQDEHQMRCRHSDELCLFEGDVGDETMTRADAHDVELRLVLMKGVQHDLQREEVRRLPVLLR